MSTDVAQENPPLSSAWKEFTDLGKRLLAKHISLKPGGQGFKQLVDQGMAPADALNTTIWRLRGTEPAPKPPNIAFNADTPGDEPGGEPGGSGTRIGANPPDSAAAADLANLSDYGAYDIRLAARLNQSGLIGPSRSR